jgi:hypothetical protein
MPHTSPDDYRWWNITAYLPILEQLAQLRDEQKGGYSSTKNWTRGGSTHFTGLCAEFAVFLETGLAIDTVLKATGDPGFDFAHAGLTYDAKGATYWQSPDLKEFPNRAKHADRYILIAVRDWSAAKVIGWATREQLTDPRRPRRNYRYGEMLNITFPEFRAMGQEGLPPDLPRRSPSRLEAIESKLAAKSARVEVAAA